MKVHQSLAMLLAAGAMALLLTGCGIFDRSYSSVTTHVDQSVTEDDPSVLRAETYQELVSSILHFVTEGESTGVVRLYQYTGDVESDLESACQEVLTQDPMGAYALTELEQSYIRIVSYYECTFTFTYRHTAEEIDNVTTISSLVSFREKLQQNMDRFESGFAVRTGLSLTEERILSLIQEYYYATPELSIGYPTVTVTFYGGEDSGQKIIEVSFVYLQSSEKSMVMQQEMLALALALMEEAGVTANSPDAAENLWAVYLPLLDYRIYNNVSGGNAYRFLSGQTGTQQGSAMAMLLLCQLMDLSCYYVEGTRDGSDHSWVMVEIGDTWAHVDLALQDEQSDFLHSDDSLLALGYSWDQTAYPACEGIARDDTDDTPDEEEDTDQPEIPTLDLEGLAGEGPETDFLTLP